MPSSAKLKIYILIVTLLVVVSSSPLGTKGVPRPQDDQEEEAKFGSEYDDDGGREKEDQFPDGRKINLNAGSGNPKREDIKAHDIPSVGSKNPIPKDEWFEETPQDKQSSGGRIGLRSKNDEEYQDPNGPYPKVPHSKEPYPKDSHTNDNRDPLPEDNTNYGESPSFWDGKDVIKRSDKDNGNNRPGRIRGAFSKIGGIIGCFIEGYHWLDCINDSRPDNSGHSD